MTTRPLACGVWPGRGGITLVLVDTYTGQAVGPPLLLSAGDMQGRYEALRHLDAAEGLDWELVLPDWLARADPLAELARGQGTSVWTAPPRAVAAVQLLGDATRLPAHRAAAAVARLLSVPVLHAQLRLHLPPDRRQLALF